MVGGENDPKTNQFEALQMLNMFVANLPLTPKQRSELRQLIRYYRLASCIATIESRPTPFVLESLKRSAEAERREIYSKILTTGLSSEEEFIESRASRFSVTS